MEQYKKETITSYDRDPSFFEQKFRNNFEQFAQEDVSLFLSELKGKKVLDIGCGPGIYLEVFRENGLDALGIDISEKFLEVCASKGLNVRKMDLENILLYPYSFDGIWAHASLLHVPRERVPSVVKSWAKLLKPHGVLWLAVKSGEGEGFEPSEKNADSKRWFTYFSEDEIKKYFSPFFEIVKGYTCEMGTGKTWIKYLFRLKPSAKKPFSNM